ncbi:MAG: hypothetical protein AMXMBFR53_22420 [Gemmatimonadota bacterium]
MGVNGTVGVFRHPAVTRNRHKRTVRTARAAGGLTAPEAALQRGDVVAANLIAVERPIRVDLTRSTAFTCRQRCIHATPTCQSQALCSVGGTSNPDRRHP